MPKGTNRKTVVLMLLFVLLLILAIPFVRAEEAPKEEQYYRTMAKQHFDLAVTQFDQKDVFAACNNLRISKSYARHINDNIINDHLILLLAKMCGGDK